MADVHPRARDYYDLWRVLIKYGKGLERSLLPELVAAKCRHRGVIYDSLDSFFSNDLVSEARRHWEASLGSFVSPLPSCGLVLDELRPLLEGLV